MKPSERGNFVIGLAGGIGSGKSTVARKFGDLGARVLDADAIARDCLKRVSVKREIMKRFGDGVFDERGGVDHARLASRVFRSGKRLRELEALIHPPVIRRIKGLLRASGEAGRVVIIDAPLLFECALDALCDAILYVRAPARIRRARLGKARGWSADEIRRRESFQMPLQKKAGKADYLIDNSGTPSETISQIRTLWKEIADARTRNVRPASSQPA